MIHPALLAFDGWLFAVALMFALWVVERLKSDAGVVDLGWTIGVGVLAIAYAVAGDGDTNRRLLVAALAGIWSFRLALYILLDRVLKDQEDGRYRELRAHWGERAHRNFFWFFESQTLLVVLFSAPMLVIAFDPRPLGGLAFAGAAVWVVSVAGESFADRQLARFRADPASRGRVCDVGLWSASRHPNYFFEWLHWWSYVLIGVGAPHGWVTLVGPIVMLLFLFKLTGIPATEKHALKSRGDAYRAYQKSTSVFIPWFPKRA